MLSAPFGSFTRVWAHHLIPQEMTQNDLNVESSSADERYSRNQKLRRNTIAVNIDSNDM